MQRVKRILGSMTSLPFETFCCFAASGMEFSQPLEFVWTKLMCFTPLWICVPAPLGIFRSSTGTACIDLYISYYLGSLRGHWGGKSVTFSILGSWGTFELIVLFSFYFFSLLSFDLSFSCSYISYTVLLILMLSLAFIHCNLGLYYLCSLHFPLFSSFPLLMLWPRVRRGDVDLRTGYLNCEGITH